MMQKFIAIINRINTWMGKGLSFLLVAMIATICYEVAARYFFDRPTIWSLELNTYLLCVYTSLAAGFTLLRGGHVNVDILYGRFSIRTKAILSCFTSFFFFIFIIVLVWTGCDLAYKSIKYSETSGTILDWPLAPTKIMVPIGGFLLLLQGVVKFMNDFKTAVTGKPFMEMESGGIFGRSKEE